MYKTLKIINIIIQIILRIIKNKKNQTKRLYIAMDGSLFKKKKKKKEAMDDVGAWNCRHCKVFGANYLFPML